MYDLEYIRFIFLRSQWKSAVDIEQLLCYFIDVQKWYSLMNHNLHTLLAFYVGMFMCDNERKQ